MIDQFKDLGKKFNDLERRMSDPEIIADQTKYQDIVKQHSELKEGVDSYREYVKISPI